MSEGISELRAKRLAKVRDNGLCRLCYRGGIWHLHGHHIRPKALYPELACDVDNLITLCLACHLGIVHSGRIDDGGQKKGNWRIFVFLFKWMIRTGSGLAILLLLSGCATRRVYEPWPDDPAQWVRENPWVLEYYGPKKNDNMEARDQ